MTRVLTCAAAMALLLACSSEAETDHGAGLGGSSAGGEGAGGSSTGGSSSGGGGGGAAGGSTGGGSPQSCSPAGEVTYDAPVTENVSFFTTLGGYELKGTLLIPEAGGKFATVVLLHQNCSDRNDWLGGASNFADDLARRGFLVLAYDARGFGESTEGGTLTYCGETNGSLFAPMVDDVGDALDFLATRSEANLDCLALGGGSMGANAALIHAGDDARVKTVVLFSPGLNYLGLSTQTAIVNFHPRPSLMFATDGDTYSANTLTTLSGGSDAVTAVVLSGDAHGASILTTYPDAHQQAMKWLADLL